jgi:hypothetical protein
VFGGEILPLLFLVRDDAAHPFRYQLILRLEVAIEGHLVGSGGFSDGLDADATNSLPVEEITCRNQNPFTNGHGRPALLRFRAVLVNICLHDRFYPFLTPMLPTGNIGVLTDVTDR